MQEKCVNHLKFTRKLERGTNIEIVIVLLAIPNNGASSTHYVIETIKIFDFNIKL